MKRDPKPLEGRTLVIGLLVAIVGMAALVAFIGLSGGSTHVPLSKPGIAFTTEPAASSGVPGPAGAAEEAFRDGGLQRTLRDRAVHDELRKRILAGWAAGGDPEVAAAARLGRFVPAPTGDGGVAMDPNYIREVVRGEFVPMAKKCYEELLSRQDASAGRMEMSFSIVADDKLGGIVEDVGVASDGGVADEKMTTCMRESMAGVSFRPPAHGGLVTVRYPIAFSPDERDE